MSRTVKNLGMVTAYAYAVSKGYTGTEEEFSEMLADVGTYTEEIRALAEEVEDGRIDFNGIEFDSIGDNIRGWTESNFDSIATANGKINTLNNTVSDINDALGNKVDKVAGKQLSTEDYTTAEKTKLGALPDAATLNADLANKQSLLQVTQSISGGYLYNNYYSVS